MWLILFTVTLSHYPGVKSESSLGTDLVGEKPMSEEKEKLAVPPSISLYTNHGEGRLKRPRDGVFVPTFLIHFSSSSSSLATAVRIHFVFQGVLQSFSFSAGEKKAGKKHPSEVTIFLESFTEASHCGTQKGGTDRNVTNQE